MNNEKDGVSRRKFLKAALASTAAAAILPEFLMAKGARFQADSLQVWSCGGLAEAFMEANALYEERNGVKINYTGAFAGALGKSLMGGAVTEVFAGRVLQLAKQLRGAGKMEYFQPLCFTQYVLVTPEGNPAGIASIQDMAKKGVRVMLPLGASPPGGDAVVGILKKAGIEQDVMKNMVKNESCVVRMMSELVKGKGDVSIVEKRLPSMERFAGQVEVLPIDEALFPPGPLTFTIGVMKYAQDRALADDYVSFIRSEEAQAIFEKCGFISAISDKGQELVRKLGVQDV